MQQINALITRVQNSTLPQAIKNRIIAGLESARAALRAGNTELAIDRLKALRDRIEASRLPAARKQALVTRINCISAALTR